MLQPWLGVEPFGFSATQISLAAMAVLFYAITVGLLENKSGGRPIALVLFVFPWGLMALPVVFAREHGVRGRLRRCCGKPAGKQSAEVAPAPPQEAQASAPVGAWVSS